MICTIVRLLFFRWTLVKNAERGGIVLQLSLCLLGSCLRLKPCKTTFTHAALSLETDLVLNLIMEICTILPTWGPCTNAEASEVLLTSFFKIYYTLILTAWF